MKYSFQTLLRNVTRADTVWGLLFEGAGTRRSSHFY